MNESTVILNRPNFLASEVGLRLVTYTMAKDNGQAVTENGRKIIKAGTVYPANGSGAVGIVFQDIDVTNGDALGSIMVAGHYYKDKITIAGDAETALSSKGLYGETEPTVTRPY